MPLDFNERADISDSELDTLKEYIKDLEAMLFAELGDKLYVKDVIWKAYPNPMRDDSIFIAEDKEIKPYKYMDGYPAIPDTKHSLHYGVPPLFAEKLIHYLNITLPKQIRIMESIYRNPEGKKNEA